ncbi:hypothetical protein [Streptomyces sp. CC228A]|uniref:hypothetical protein n=1 Tax=Streptomyces sp. CC228A TaxID=2898186 RepID=UPI001F3A25DF|nr:hypothetical protein [Streptomyces sp. CC228A]
MLHEDPAVSWEGTVNKEQRRRVIAEVQTERERLLPLREEATETTIAAMRQSAAAEPLDLVPYLNLAYLLGVRHTRGDDGLLAFALSLANWAAACIKEVAEYTGRTTEEVIDQYETELMEARMAQAVDGDGEYGPEVHGDGGADGDAHRDGPPPHGC